MDVTGSIQAKDPQGPDMLYLDISQDEQTQANFP